MKRSRNNYESGDSYQDLPPARTVGTGGARGAQGPCSKASKVDLEDRNDPHTSCNNYSENAVGFNEYLKKKIWKLFDEGHTIPFLARYRKEVIGGLSPDALRHLHDEHEVKKEVETKAKKLLEKTEKSGQLSQEVRKCIQSATTLDDIETLAAQFKTSSAQSLATRARAIPDLEATAHIYLQPASTEKLPHLKAEGLTKEDKENIGYIIADILLHKPEVCEFINTTLSHDRSIAIVSKQNKSQTKENSAFKNYFDFKCYIKQIKSHQVLAINRGEKRKELKVTVDIPDGNLEKQLERFCLNLVKAHTNYERSQLISASISEAYKRLVKPSIKRKVRSSLTKTAESQGLDVFAENLRELLLTLPCRNSVVMGLDPGFKHGCKVAVIDVNGNVLQTGVVYPRVQDLSVKDETFLIESIEKFKVDIIGIGNRSGFGQTEKIVAKLISKCKKQKVAFTSVNEDGASIYSVTKEATEEFPDLDPNLISAISIARRLQDPLSEYVKIGPSHLGVGMYQHDIKETRLTKTLNDIVTECVSFVGVDLNQAPSYLLSYVSGITANMAQKIVKWRCQNGQFGSRDQLRKVKGIGEKAFQQCAGFVRIMPKENTRGALSRDTTSSTNPLDATLIHPESYSLAERLLTSLGFSSNDVGNYKLIKYFRDLSNGERTALMSKEVVSNKDAGATSEAASREKIQLILEALALDPFQDYRDYGLSKKPIQLRTEVLTIDNLKIGQTLEGTVKNVTHFGAFVDIGIGKDALLHQSELRSQTVKLGQRIDISIKTIDKPSSRVGLKLPRNK